MFCVVKCETPPVLRWKLCEFPHKKSISISGINFIVWRGLGSKRDDGFSKAEAGVDVHHLKKKAKSS